MIKSYNEDILNVKCNDMEIEMSKKELLNK